MTRVTHWPAEEGMVEIQLMSNSHLLNAIWFVMRRTGDMVKVNGINYVKNYPTASEFYNACQHPKMGDTFRALTKEARARELDWQLATCWQPPAQLLDTGTDALLELPADCPWIPRNPRPACLVGGDSDG